MPRPWGVADGLQARCLSQPKNMPVACYRTKKTSLLYITGTKVAALLHEAVKKIQPSPPLMTSRNTPPIPSVSGHASFSMRQASHRRSSNNRSAGTPLRCIFATRKPSKAIILPFSTQHQPTSWPSSTPLRKTLYAGQLRWVTYTLWTMVSPMIKSETTSMRWTKVTDYFIITVSNPTWKSPFLLFNYLFHPHLQPVPHLPCLGSTLVPRIHQLPSWLCSLSPPSIVHLKTIYTGPQRKARRLIHPHQISIPALHEFLVRYFYHNLGKDATAYLP